MKISRRKRLQRGHSAHCHRDLRICMPMGTCESGMRGAQQHQNLITRSTHSFASSRYAHAKVARLRITQIRALHRQGQDLVGARRVTGYIHRIDSHHIDAHRTVNGIQMVHRQFRITQMRTLLRRLRREMQLRKWSGQPVPITLLLHGGVAIGKITLSLPFRYKCQK